MSDATDTELIDRIYKHDEEALAEFVERRRRPLMAFINRRVGAALRRQVEPEDILQEAATDAVRSLGEFDLGDRDPFGWLCHLAERRIIDAHRFHQAQKRAADRNVSLDRRRSASGGSAGGGLVDLLVISMTTASQLLMKDEKMQALADVMENLPERNQKALKLRYVEGMRTKEIAERLDMSDGAVRVLLSRTLAKLRDDLGE